jgi:hypothetical protein
MITAALADAGLRGDVLEHANVADAPATLKAQACSDRPEIRTRNPFDIVSGA